jgi:predicted site-specific integrase-resolvase
MSVGLTIATVTMLRGAEAARRLGVSVRELVVLVDRGELPRDRDEFGRLMVPEDAVEALRARLAG